MQAPEENLIANSSRPGSQRKAWLITSIVIGIALVISAFVWFAISSKTTSVSEKTEGDEQSAPSDKVDIESGSAGIQITSVTSAPPIATIKATGVVEANDQQMQQISALASGRVSSVNVSLGDAVRPGMLLIRIESPQVAEMHGKLHEAETKLKLARATVERVKQAANRVFILKAKASFDEAESTLKRTKQLYAEGLTAGKDMVAAQSEFDRAKAEYNFQKDISLNKEVAEAVANLHTSETESEHIRDALKALDAQMGKDGEGTEHDISVLELRSPITGTVIDRMVNPGAGVEAGKPLLTIANTSTLWVIANVPEKDMTSIHLEMPATVQLEGRMIPGTVSYIDPRLNEDTRTSRVRIVIQNSNNRIQTGSFAQIEFRSTPPQGVVYVPTAAVQSMDGHDVVFVKESDGVFRARKVRTRPEIEGIVPVESGLSVDEKVAADGSFVLKSKMLKSQLGDDD